MKNENRCKHRVTYYSATNILLKGKPVGVVDTYHCRKCRKLFSDLRRIGVPEILGQKIGKNK